MRPSIFKTCPGSLPSLFRQTATQPRRSKASWSGRKGVTSSIDTSLRQIPSYPNSIPSRAFEIYNMDMPNIQWWAKPAPNSAASPNQTGGFAIPGLGNSTNNGPFPFPTPQPPSAPQVTSARQPPATNQPAIPKGPRANRPAGERDKIVAPSLASGGVPEPTADYLHRASIPPTLLPSPKPILVVMDLNGTLLYRPNRRNATSFVERPHAKRFLQYCLDTFHVVIWSSARPANVQSMCDQLLLGPPGPGASVDRAAYRRRVLAVWGRDRFGLSKADYNLRVQVYKRLQMVWNDPRVKASHPDAEFGGCWDQSNTVLVDDSSEKARSEPFNLLRIPEFFGNETEPGLIVPQVHDYLNSLCYQSDISSYMRTNPFYVRDDYKLAPPEEQ
ncbi:FCP1-like protein [Colletotrichum truncatum]|uniref:FCP1-like protein n=1 Tax=Colletotrichum truncatum TaxID=5467 RepID=A0ACC3ZJ31_COLTU|nr:FCP1-like protein [Colletotrichum truncatum]KAF6791925.1 FCP1-like protein [Colletotrichum truncatum]